MGSIFSSGTIPLTADEEAVAEAKEMCGYPFSVPKVFLDGSADSYYPQVDFSWGDDGIVVVRENCITTYTKSSFTELLAEDENGNVIWVDGRSAPYEGHWSGKYLNKTRAAEEYKIVEYNLATSEKKTYKVTPVETVPLDARDREILTAFVDSETLENTFEIKDRVLEMYNGSSDNIRIPDSVSEIGYRAFSNHNAIGNLHISKSVVNINSNTFERAINKVEVDPDNPRYYCQDGLLIDRKTKTLLRAYAGNKIPNDGSVTAIGDSAFRCRSDIKDIEIPDSVTTIGHNAFFECVNLEKVVISDSVTTIGGRAFYNCESLAEIRLPSAITKISWNMLGGCSKLKSVTIPDTVTDIEHSAFSNCISLENIIIPDSVYQIASCAFEECSSLSEVKLPIRISSIPNHLFAECKQLKHITIPNSVFQIHNNAFSGCSSLEEIDLPDAVVEIGSYAFSDCTNLKKVNLPREIVTIENGLFEGCKQLSDIEIPQTVTKIENSAFSHCTKLDNIFIPPSVKKINYWAFSNSGLTSLTVPDSVKVIEDGAFRGCRKLERVEIPSWFRESGKRIFDRELIQNEDGSYCLQPLRKRENNDSSEWSCFEDFFDHDDLPF